MDADAAGPFDGMGEIAAAKIAQDLDRGSGDVERVIRIRAQHAGDREIGVADGLDPLAVMMLGDLIESREDLVQFQDQLLRLLGNRHAREADEIEEHYRQSREKVGYAFIKGAGLAEIADTNRLIILFPQVEASMVNPHGCWDWWGYTDLDYLS